MPLDLLVVGVSRQADGRSYIGFGRTTSRGEGFVRLVAPTPTGVLYPQDYQVQGMADPQVGDLVRVEAPWADSRPCQPENRVVDHTEWQLLERPASRLWLHRLEQTPVDSGPLFGTPGRAVRAEGRSFPSSIAYVEPGDATAVCEWDERKARYRARLRFTVGAFSYDLPLTDMRYTHTLCRRPEGAYSLHRLGCRAPHGLRLLVTLGEPFHGWCYKMVAALLPRRTVTLMRDVHSATDSLPVRHPAGNPLEFPGSFVVGA